MHKERGMEEGLRCSLPLHVGAHPSRGPLKTQESLKRTETSGDAMESTETPYNPQKWLVVPVPPLHPP